MSEVCGFVRQKKLTMDPKTYMQILEHSVGPHHMSSRDSWQHTRNFTYVN